MTTTLEPTFHDGDGSHRSVESLTAVLQHSVALAMQNRSTTLSRAYATTNSPL
jgi:hypothetical protein